MNNALKQSEIINLSEELKRCSELIDLYYNDLTTEHLFISEVNRLRNIDWGQENAINQLLSNSVLASAYCVLKNKKLACSTAYR